MFLAAAISWPAAIWLAVGILIGIGIGWLAARLVSKWSLDRHRSEIASLAVQARTDSLTGLANRRVLEDEFARRLALWREQGTPLVLVIADVDHFKRINDEHGLAAGDAALAHLATVIKGTLRQSDLVARFGGDEFAILLTAADLAQAGQALSRLQAAIADAPPLFDGVPLSLTVSFGASAPSADTTVGDLFRRADAALKAAKQHGRDCAFGHDGKSARWLEWDSTLTPRG
jgi:diguanylate cyclase (GGDEF)-like protein